MTTALSQVAAASQRIADAVSLGVPTLSVVTNVVAPISPPAVVIGPPKLYWRGYNQGGQPTTGAWNVYLVTALGMYALEQLLSLVASISAAIELHTPGVVLGAGPGVYPSPQGGLPAYIISTQLDFGAL
ncbi:MAG: hypothetical protein ACRDS0_36890 [Pseudonocardiaceae bacterium]